MGPLIPLFWTVCLGFQSQGRSPHLRALAVKPFLSTYLVVVSSNYRPQTKSASWGSHFASRVVGQTPLPYWTLRDTVNEQAVPIVLECILVLLDFVVQSTKELVCDFAYSRRLFKMPFHGCFLRNQTSRYQISVATQQSAGQHYKVQYSNDIHLRHNEHVL